MKLGAALLFIFAATIILPGPVPAGEVVPELTIDGVTYHDVRWGPAHQGKVSFIHNRGAEMNVPIEKLPLKYQQQFGRGPGGHLAPPVTNGADRSTSAFARLQREQARRQLEEARARQAALEARRQTKILFEGRIVDKSSLTRLTGFLQARALFEGEEGILHGVVLELARRREGQHQIPEYMRMRPGLWERTGEEVFLRDYQLETPLGELVHLYGVEKDPVKKMRSFVVGTELASEPSQPPQ